MAQLKAFKGIRPVQELVKLVALFLVLPWLLWNQLNFGSLVQGSGKVETIYWGEPHFNLQHILYSFLTAPISAFQNLQVFSEIFIIPSVNRSLLAIIFVVCWLAAILFFLS